MVVITHISFNYNSLCYLIGERILLKCYLFFINYKEIRRYAWSMDTEHKHAAFHSLERRDGNRMVTVLIACILVFGALALSAMPSRAATNPFLAATQVDSSDISPFTKWTALMPRYEMQRASAQKKCIGEGASTGNGRHCSYSFKVSRWKSK